MTDDPVRPTDEPGLSTDEPRLEVEAGQVMLDHTVLELVDGRLSGADAAKVKLFRTEVQGSTVDRSCSAATAVSATSRSPGSTPTRASPASTPARAR